MKHRADNTESLFNDASFPFFVSFLRTHVHQSDEFKSPEQKRNVSCPVNNASIGQRCYCCSLNLAQREVITCLLPERTQGSERRPVLAATREASYVFLSSRGRTCSNRWSMDTISTQSRICSRWASCNTHTHTHTHTHTESCFTSSH